MSYKPPTDRCELCKYYFMIDSGYGECRRFPPAWEYQKEKWWQRLKNKLTYLIVSWETNACGEFITKSSFNKVNLK